MRPRIRTVKPEFFQHGELYDAEVDTGLPLRLAFAGLWCWSDREGRFEWKPRELKLNILPYDDVDFARVLDALEARGFICRYPVTDGRTCGWIPTFTRHQVINNREQQSQIPAPPPEALTAYRERHLTRDSRVLDASAPESHAAQGELEWKGTGREGESQLHGGATRRAKSTTANNNDGNPTFADLMGLVRKYLDVLDGKPPVNWDEARDGSILKQLLKHRRAADVALVIEGLAILRDHPGVFADAVDWLQPGAKATLKALYNTRSGVLSTYELARQAYWKHANTRRDRAVAGSPEPIAEIVAKVLPGRDSEP